MRTSFKTYFKERSNMAVVSNFWVTINVYKKLSSCYHMKKKTFIEASCINDIYTCERLICSCYFLRFVRRFFSGTVKKVYSILWSVWDFFAFLEKKRPNRYCLWEENLVYKFCIQISGLMCQNVKLFWK